MMASAELGDILNLKISGPRMFDQDGRVVTTEQVEVKEKDSPEEAGKELANQIDKQMATLSGQIDEEIRKAQKEVERTIRENDDNQRLQANADMQNKRTLKQNVNGIKIGISSLLPILRDVMR
jgi:microcystin degradation protein MlrC